jgi:hypothetical protein
MPKDSDLTGRYVLRDEWGQSALELRQDGNFTEEAVLTNGERIRVEGKWRYDSGNLTRKPCLKIEHEGVAAKSIDLCIQPVDKSLGGIGITVSSGYGLTYRR